MTSVEDIREAILALTPEDQARLMVEVGPALCRSVIQNPESMFPRCDEMMRNPEVQQVMRPMMEHMFTKMLSGSW